MVSVTSWGILILFIAAWLTPVVIIVYYRAVNVPARYAEIRDFLFSSPEGDRPARHYTQLFLSDNPTLDESTPASVLEGAIRKHFMGYHGWPAYALPLSLLLLFSAGGLYFVWAWATQTLLNASPFGAVGPTLSKELVFALAGAYAWSLWEVCQRRQTRNLTPDEVYDIAIRYLFALPVGYSATLLSVDSVDAAFAFAVAALPIRDLNLLYRRRVLEKMKVEPVSQASARVGYLRDVVDGLSPATLARLEELQIVTFTDLAYADPIELMVKTGFSLRHIIQWMDHATLAIYALDHKKVLAENAIVCSLDAKEFYECHFEDKDVVGRCDFIDTLAERTKVPTETIEEIFARISADPQVLFLETMWYTGYLGKPPEPRKCPHHKKRLGDELPAEG
jgi:hypothetical protein